MNKKGFTLVELLAVIAILAVLVIIAVPNVMSLFNEAKRNSFQNEIATIYKEAQQEWITDSLTETSDIVYSRCDTCDGKSLQLSGRQDLDYYIKINRSGEVAEFYASDGNFQYVYEGDAVIAGITNIERVADIQNEDDIIIIKPTGIYDIPKCELGEYLDSTTNSCQICPANYYCPYGLRPILCPSGKISPSGSYSEISCRSGAGLQPIPGGGHVSY
jgi:prepilin-type N-terminal cleavage/methylation domain-containing protein